MFKTKVTGIKELERNMADVVKELEDAMETGTQDGAEYAAGILRRNAPGSLSKGVATKSLPRKGNYPPNTMVGILWDGYQHAHLVEFGTGPRYTASGAYRGQMPADPFFRRSIDEAKSGVKSRIRQPGKDVIDRRRG